MIVAFVFSRVVLPRLIARARIQREETVRMAAQARDEELCVELAARSGEMTVLAEKLTRFPDKLLLNLPCFPFKRW